MTMFECGREIEILHGAFISALKSISAAESDKPLNFCDLNDRHLEVAVSIVQQTIDFVASGYGRSVKGWSESDEYLSRQKMHTAIFYQVLRSCGITCRAAEEYYESISDRLVALDWKFYMRLITGSFSDHFTDCVIQLPDDVAVMLLEWTMKEFSKQCNFPHVLHSLLQILAHKLSNLKYNASNSISRFDFAFKFTTDESAPTYGQYRSDGKEDGLGTNQVNQSEVAKKFEISFDDISNQVLHILTNRQNDLSLLRILLTWLISVLDKWSTSDVDWTSVVSSKYLETCFHFIKNYTEAEMVVCYLKTMLNSFHYEQFMLSLSSGSCFGAHPGYVLYLIRMKWLKLEERLNNEAEQILQSEVVKTLKETIVGMCSLHPLFSSSTISILEPYVDMLVHLVDHKLDGMSYAWELLLQENLFRIKKEIISCIERNLLYCVSNHSIMEHFMDAAVKETGPEKLEVTRVFLKAYRELIQPDQHSLLRTFLCKYGLSTALKQPSFEIDLSNFFTRSVQVEQAIHLIAPLCIQSAEETVNKIISRIVQHGSSAIIAVEALKTVDFVCCYCDIDGSPPLLLRLLQSYFTTDHLKQVNTQHILVLIQELLKVFSDSDSAFPLEQFFMLCILPNLYPQLTNTTLKFALELLNMILTHSVDVKRADWLKDINLRTTCIASLCCLINLSIITLNGHLKENVIYTLERFSELRTFDCLDVESLINRKWLHHLLSSMHPLVQFYVWDYIHDQNVELSTLDLQGLISWWVICKADVSPIVHDQIKDSISLVAALAQVVPHFSAEELLQLSVIFDGLDIQIFPEYATRLLTDSSNPEVLKKKLMAINLSEVLVDVFLLLESCRDVSFDWPYMLSSFTKVINVCLHDVRTCPFTSAKVFLEVCRLAEPFRKNFDVLSVILLGILDKLKCSSVDPKILKSCKNYLLAAVHKLERSDTKYRLLCALK